MSKVFGGGSIPAHRQWQICSPKLPIVFVNTGRCNCELVHTSKAEITPSGCGACGMFGACGRFGGAGG